MILRREMGYYIEQGEKVAAILRLGDHTPAEMNAILACAMDNVVFFSEGVTPEEMHKFKQDTVSLVRDLIFFPKEAQS